MPKDKNIECKVLEDDTMAIRILQATADHLSVRAGDRFAIIFERKLKPEERCTDRYGNLVSDETHADGESVIEIYITKKHIADSKRKD